MLSVLLIAASLSVSPAHSLAPEPDPPASPGADRVPNSHGLALASEVGLSAVDLFRAQEAVRLEVARGGFPGAALAIGRWGKTVVERGVGRLDRTLGAPEVDPDLTIYDLASLTKVVATTTAVMLLVEDGKLDLDAPVRHYLPAFGGGAKDWVTVRHLLAHTSGLPAGADIWAPTPEGSLQRAIAVPLRFGVGSQVVYSDVGFIVLWAVAERAAGEPLYRMLDRRVFGPLQMLSTTFLPGQWCERCAPTEQRKDGTEIRGVVHDPNARRLGGIAGHAGLFATVHDLTRFAAMMANGGELDGVRVLEERTIREFTRRQPGAGTRALGWDTSSRSASGGASGVRMSPQAYGHTGFTGTSLWIDPDRGTWVVLLSNRTYQPQGPNRIQAVRRSVHDLVATAADMAALQD
jgi:serine-type D-Ala-D-Ala carboxypeptidase